jgi:hypothetical protein
MNWRFPAVIVEYVPESMHSRPYMNLRNPHAITPAGDSSMISRESIERAGIAKILYLAHQAKRHRSGEFSVAGCNRHIDTGGYRQA